MIDTTQNGSASRATIVVAGAGGDLGDRIVKALVAQGANVRALVRSSATEATRTALAAVGAQALTVDYETPPL